ncbi:non-ribosomal peptide synthetase [Mycobacterium stomatepiae]|uniref:non-ribosomal peptide synthetase n=1 Tax=Mycobacterium stomatepiae TaxID=470076 RepID=UPI0013D4D89E|nr:non-ribosomal peptide synthetase [Mycobacterium stomatepiae]MCV7163084.1 non-ribosomal peptide synthetase [Mycobacterium stomatepiae]
MAEEFLRSVGRHPANIAVSYLEQELSYADLLGNATAISHAIQRRAPANAIVALTQRRGFELIATIVGITMAGCAYLPLDPAYPTRRLQYCLRDSGASLLIGDNVPGSDVQTVSFTKAVNESRHAGDAAIRTAASNDPAYIIYTSGSTGTPKGVVVEHRNVLALFAATATEFSLCESDVWTMFHSSSFDFSVWEMWGALLHGGRIVIVDEHTARSPKQFVELVDRQAITILSQTPTAFAPFSTEALATKAPLDALRLVIFGGERLEPAGLADWILARGTSSPELVNMYGITETTVHTTQRRLDINDVQRTGRSPIGRPLPGLGIHLLDASLAPVPEGKAGEIVVTGPGVARGYLNRPELDTQRFITLPLGLCGSLVRCYRSGDIARRDGDDLVYLGRADAQLKVRGYRIEPQEIETVLISIDGVNAAAVVAAQAGPGDDRLVAFVVDHSPVQRRLQNEAVTCLRPAARETEIREAVGALLPAHLCPNHVFFIDELPRSTNGKVDVVSLSARASDHLSKISGGAGAAVASTNKQDGSDDAGAVFEIVQRVLRLNPFEPDRDIFDAGATSLAVVRLLAEINAVLDLELVPADLADNSSPSGIARVAAERRNFAAPAETPLARAVSTKPPRRKGASL